MSAATAVAVALACLLLGMALGHWLPWHRRRAVHQRQRPAERILLPFTGQAISRRAFQAAIRLAKAENATLMPAFLARVPRQLPLDSPLPAQAAQGMPLLEAIEQRASREGVSVEARVSRGRSYRDALRQLLEQEQFDRIIISANDSPRKGLGPDDLRWLLEAVPAEVLILRPAPGDSNRLSAAVGGHF